MATIQFYAANIKDQTEPEHRIKKRAFFVRESDKQLQWDVLLATDRVDWQNVTQEQALTVFKDCSSETQKLDGILSDVLFLNREVFFVVRDSIFEDKDNLVSKNYQNLKATYIEMVNQPTDRVLDSEPTKEANKGLPTAGATDQEPIDSDGLTHSQRVTILLKAISMAIEEQGALALKKFAEILRRAGLPRLYCMIYDALWNRARASLRQYDQYREPQ